MKVNKRLIDFVKKNRISVLTTLLSNGKPHSATMHYATKKASLEFIFFTREKSRKCKHFVIGKKYPASLVIGFSEKEWIEVQMEGLIEKIDRAKSKNEVMIFASKFTGASLAEDHIVLKFKPSWWRYTEFEPEPPKIISSEK